MEETQIYEYELIPGLRASSNLLYIKDNVQIFKYKYTSNNVKYYYCYQKNCNVGVAVDINNPIYCRKSGKFQNHNHGPQGELYAKLKVINDIKNEVKKAPLKRQSIRDIFDQECKKSQEEVTIDYGKMRRQLYNIKRQTLPQAPMSFANIIDIFRNEEVVQQFAMSRYESEHKFYAGTTITDNFSYTLFVSPTISQAIQSMPEPRDFILDATFNVAPMSREFEQLLIIYIVYEEHAFPFIYGLMSDNTEAAYTHMLQHLKSNIIDLQPDKIVIDYENDLRNAIKKVYPTVKMVGCWFHYINQIRRKVSEIPGFINELNENDEDKVFFNKFLYLPLLKPSDIETAFQILKAKAMAAKYIKENMSGSYFQPFIEYFQSYWINKEQVANFSVYKDSIRFSNSAESFHSQLNIKFPKQGNFYRFLDFLGDLDYEKSKDFFNTISGGPSSNTNKNCSYKKRNELVEQHYQLVREKKITLNTLLTVFSKMENCTIEESFINTTDNIDDVSDENSSPEEIVKIQIKEEQDDEQQYDIEILQKPVSIFGI